MSLFLMTQFTSAPQRQDPKQNARLRPSRSALSRAKCQCLQRGRSHNSRSRRPPSRNDGRRSGRTGGDGSGGWLPSKGRRSGCKRSGSAASHLNCTGKKSCRGRPISLTLALQAPTSRPKTVAEEHPLRAVAGPPAPLASAALSGPGRLPAPLAPRPVSRMHVPRSQLLGLREGAGLRVQTSGRSSGTARCCAMPLAPGAPRSHRRWGGGSTARIGARRMGTSMTKIYIGWRLRGALRVRPLPGQLGRC